MTKSNKTLGTTTNKTYLNKSKSSTDRHLIFLERKNMTLVSYFYDLKHVSYEF
jgi:hypothetical protein